MPAANYLPEVLETTEAECLATGFIFTEGPLWHPEGYWYFVDIRQNKLFRMTPGKPPEDYDNLEPARHPPGERMNYACRCALRGGIAWWPGPPSAETAQPLTYKAA